MFRKKMFSMALISGLLTPLAGGILLTATPALAAVTCTTHHKNGTAGWINCQGKGTVKLIIDCRKPQIGDYKSDWTTFNGSTTIRGECRHGINSVQYLVR